jgi:pyrimidine deaminase RibD-like protein
MIKPRDPRELAIDLLPRSICSVRVAAVLADGYGIFCWGWNNPGEGFGQHAEAHAIMRANKRRLRWATIYVASERARNDKAIMSKPCVECQKLVSKWDLEVVYRNGKGEWVDG